MAARSLNPFGVTEALKKVVRDYYQRSHRAEQHLVDLKFLSAKLLINQIEARGLRPTLHDAEFKVSSQFGDDGIIQYLLQHVEVASPAFVEFGVEDYTESNTRFLLLNNNWRGLVMDGSTEHVDAIRRDPVFWKHELHAVQAFVDRDNINGLLRDAGFAGPLGILSIDIDGNDYWVWQAIDVVEPTIVVVEYNSVFGARDAITVPYDPAFRRTLAHPSNLFWGCSLKALSLLAERKGYALVGSNSAGNNAYFVRRERLGRLRALTAEEGYVQSRFRESRHPDGTLSYLAGDARRQAIEDMFVHDVEHDRRVRIRDLPDRKA